MLSPTDMQRTDFWQCMVYGGRLRYLFGICVLVDFRYRTLYRIFLIFIRQDIAYRPWLGESMRSTGRL